MNSPNDNIHTASGVAQNKKVRVRASGRGARSKSKLHSPHKLTVSGNSLMHLLRVWGGKWGQRTVSVLELVQKHVNSFFSNLYILQDFHILLQ